MTEEWQEIGLEKQSDYAILTAEISRAIFGMTPNKYKKHKNMPEKSKANLRDNMTDLDRIFTPNTMNLHYKTLFTLYPIHIYGFCIIFFLDLVTKIISKRYLSEYDSIEIIPNFFHVKLAFNKGIAFSLPVPYFLQIISGIILLGFIVYWARQYFEEVSVYEKWGVTLLLAGASANLWERIIANHVTDFIYFFYKSGFISFSCPIFNIADIAIFCGVVLWFWGSIKAKK